MASACFVFNQRKGWLADTVPHRHRMFIRALTCPLPISFHLCPPRPPPQPLGSVADWFLALATRDSGILYEDPHLQVCVHVCVGGQGGVVLCVRVCGCVCVCVYEIEREGSER